MVLAELAEVLARHGGVRASFTIQTRHASTLVDEVSINITTEYEKGKNYCTRLAELAEDLRRVRDLAQVRRLSERYGVPPESLVVFLTKEE